MQYTRVVGDLFLANLRSKSPSRRLAPDVAEAAVALRTENIEYRMERFARFAINIESNTQQPPARVV